MEEKLYSPLQFYLRDNELAAEGHYDDVHYWRDELSHEEAYEYLADIKAALADDRQRYDNGRGLMEYHPGGPAKEKVRSLVPHVELHGDQLYMVAHLQIDEALEPLELANLKSWWGGQLSDGWGEGLEQHEIKVGRGELYIEPWSSSSSFFIATQEEFEQRFPLEQAGEQNRVNRDALLEGIARDHCFVDTLTTQKSDRMDFHDISVWSLKAALEAAYEAGQEHQRDAEHRPGSREEPAPGAMGKPSLLDGVRQAQERIAQNDQQNEPRGTSADIPEPEL